MSFFYSFLAQASKFLDGTTAETADGAKGSFWMPFRASSYAGDVDWTFYFIYWICVIFTALILFLLIYFTIKYRHKSNGPAPARPAAHNTALELTWTIVPIVLVLTIFYFGFRTYMDQVVVPPDAYEINVKGQMWSWSFTYPDGNVQNELHVPVGVPVRLVLTSGEGDVIHSFFVPVLRLKKDVVPGRYNQMWFKADTVGRYQAFCAEYCGTNHSQMAAVVVVHPLEASDDEEEEEGSIVTWAQWLDSARDPRQGGDPVTVGHELYASRGCNQCHTVDGSASIGPTWKDMFGEETRFRDGTSQVADENYVMQSINQPNAKVVAGFQPVMPTYQGQFKQDEYTALIAYMKSISSHAPNYPKTWADVDAASGQGK